MNRPGEKIKAFMIVELIAVALAGSFFIGVSGETTVRFSFVCATPSPMPQKVEVIVAELFSKYRDHGVANWGDRAVIQKLGDSGKEIYFVPLNCGATGNCKWALVDSRLGVSLGVLDAAVIQYDLKDSWPEIHAYSHMGSGEGDLESFIFTSGKYVPKSSVHLSGRAVDEFESCIDRKACCPR